MATRSWAWTGNVPEEFGDGSTEEGLLWLRDHPPAWSERTMSYQVYALQKAGKYHWQGFTQFKKPQTMKKVIDYIGIPKVHVEKMHTNSNPTAASKYVTEDEKKTNIGEVYTHGVLDPDDTRSVVKQGGRPDLLEWRERILKDRLTADDVLAEVPDMYCRYKVGFDRWIAAAEAAAPVLEEKDTKEWIESNPKCAELRKRIDEYMAAKDGRKILWVWSSEHKKGKTTTLVNWANEYMASGKKLYMCKGGRDVDVAHAYRGEPTVVIDIPKGVGNKVEGIPYGFIEQVMDRQVTSTKFHVVTYKLREWPHVIIGTNVAPDGSQLASDRFIEICMD